MDKVSPPWINAQYEYTVRGRLVVLPIVHMLDRELPTYLPTFECSVADSLTTEAGAPADLTR